jgi:hypothetical protein
VVDKGEDLAGFGRMTNFVFLLVNPDANDVFLDIVEWP